MAKLLDKLSQCVSRMQRCAKMFVRPAGVGKEIPVMCRNCKDDARVMLVSYLKGQASIDGLMVGVFVSKEYMLNWSNGMVELFASHMGSIDEDEFVRWWTSNTIGQESDKEYPTHKMFLNYVVRRYADKNVGIRSGVVQQRMPIPELSQGNEPSPNPATPEAKKAKAARPRKSDVSPEGPKPPSTAVVSIGQDTASADAPQGTEEVNEELQAE